MITSDTVGALAAALAKAQGAMAPAAKDAKNPHFASRYAGLASIWDACRGPLAANALSVVQGAETDGPRVTVTTRLLHASGEWIASSLTLTARDAAPQSVGSALTYGRRYALAALVGVSPDDDDGEAAHGRPGASTAPAAATPAERTAGNAKPRAISAAQRTRAYAIATKAGWSDVDVKRLLERFGVQSSKDLLASDYDRFVEALETGALPSTGSAPPEGAAHG